MANPHRAAIETLIGIWKAKLGLSDWDIRLAAAAPEDSRADVEPWVEKQAAVIRVSHELKPSELNQVICHEMVHVAMAEFSAEVADLISSTAAPHPGTLERFEEVAVTRITGALTGEAFQTSQGSPAWVEAFGIPERPGAKEFLDAWQAQEDEFEALRARIAVQGTIGPIA